MRKPLSSSLIVAAALHAGLAHGEDVKQYADCAHEPTETDVTAAKGAFQAGNASFEEADYARAIVYWEDAYRRDCTAHGMLLNLARAYELSGNKAQAVVALRTYLVRVPTADKDKIERRIEVLNKQLDAERAQAAAQQQQAAQPPVAPAPATTPIAPPPPVVERVKPPLAALVVAGVGGVAAIVGGVLFVTGKSDLAEADDKCPDRNNCGDPQVRADGNSARTRATVGTWLGVGGVAMVGGGLAWYFLSPRTKSTAERQGFTPVALPSYVGLSYRTAF
ncbi:MAG TPA: hypothetical protein VFQ35_10015 [Polyangiaceae bacterium]|nr:hypothetical protein [Polyangiaceae bacterium]